MSVSVKISPQDKAKFNKDLKIYLKKFDVKKDDALMELGFNIRFQAIKILDSQKTSDTGRLRNSIDVTKNISGGVNVETTSGYGKYVEFGRGAGGMPPIAALEKWVRRKLGVNAKRAKSIAFVIARGIAERGTKAQPFLKPAFEREKRKLILELRKKIAKIK